MRATNISLMIDSICKKLNIPYESKNPHYQSFVDDAIKLGVIYQDLKIMIGEIQDIEIRHGLGGLKEKFDVIIKHLDETDHDLIRLAKQLKNKENDNS
jgi:hypothetical protein